MTDHERLTRLLGGPDLRWLVERARRRLERGESLDSAVTLTGATQAQRAAVDRLLGRRPQPGTSLTVPLPAVDAVLRRSGACPDGLAAAVVALSGPVVDRMLARAEDDRFWQEAYAPAALAASAAGIGEWYDQIVRSGLARRLTGTPAQAAYVLGLLAAVIAALPADGEPLATFAARVAGGAHALDEGRPLATLAFGAARAIGGVPDGSGATWRRAVWASVGLVRDELSSTVLTLGLPGDPHTATGRALVALREAGEPAVLTLRQLLHDCPDLRPPTVYVCENPAVVSAAADQLGTGCQPLICVAGQPGVAALHLLRHLAGTGTALAYHGDFDWGGLRAANTLFTRLPIRPWRYTATDYHAALPHGRPLTGTPTDASWDPALRPAMTEAALAIEEEHIIPTLLTDLTT